MLPLVASAILGPLAMIGAPMILALLYARRAHTLAVEGHDSVPRWRQASCYCGLLVIAVALVSLDGAGRELLFMNVSERLLIGDIAPLLLVLGLTGPLIAPALRVGFVSRLSILAHPPIALALWAIDLYAWHLPVLYEAALRHPGVNALALALLLGCAANMWMCLFGPLPTPSWFGDLAKLIYILAVRLIGALFGNILLWSGNLIYPYYTHSDAIHHIAPVADQNIAGAVIVAEEAVLTLCLLCWLFLRTTGESQYPERHVRWLCDVRGLGRDRLPDLDADPPLRLADPAAHARAHDRGDVRRGDLLDHRVQRRDPGNERQGRLVGRNDAHRRDTPLAALSPTAVTGTATTDSARHDTSDVR
jgi:putative membrane protein